GGVRRLQGETGRPRAPARGGHRDSPAALDRGPRQPRRSVLSLPRSAPRAARLYPSTNLPGEPKPAEKPGPPIWIATNPKPELTTPRVADRALRRVGLLADGWMTDNTPVARFRERLGVIRQVAREANRPTERMEAALHLMVNINDDRRTAFEEAVKFLHAYYSPAMTREYIEDWLAYGPPAAVVGKIAAYVAAGCTTPILRFTAGGAKGPARRRTL